MKKYFLTAALIAGTFAVCAASAVVQTAPSASGMLVTVAQKLIAEIDTGTNQICGADTSCFKLTRRAISHLLTAKVWNEEPIVTVNATPVTVDSVAAQVYTALIGDVTNLCTANMKNNDDLAQCKSLASQATASYVNGEVWGWKLPMPNDNIILGLSNASSTTVGSQTSNTTTTRTMCVWNGGQMKMSEGSSIRACQSETGNPCVCEQRVCQHDGSFSGSYTATSCTESGSSGTSATKTMCNLPGGGKMSEGSSIRACQSETGNPCVCEQRICQHDGTLSGAYKYNSCTEITATRAACQQPQCASGTVMTRAGQSADGCPIYYCATTSTRPACPVTDCAAGYTAVATGTDANNCTTYSCQLNAGSVGGGTDPTDNTNAGPMVDKNYYLHH